MKSVLSTLLLCLAVLAGSSASAAEPRQGGILKIALAGDPALLDPANNTSNHAQAVMSHIFETLTPQYYDAQKKEVLQVPKTLVESQAHSVDGKVWTFTLRKGVKFQDGTPFNAEAVKFNIDRLKSDKPKTLYGSRVTFAIDKAEVVDEHTVRMTLKQPFGPLLHVLGDYMGAMVSPDSVRKYGAEVGQHPVGTGPFKFVKWVPGSYIELEAFKEYWGGAPHLDGIIFKFAPDSNARMNMLQTGEVDLALNIPPQDHERLKKLGFDVASWNSHSMMRLWLDSGVPPTNDVRVRRAIKMALDTVGMVDGLYLGNARPADSSVSRFTFGYFPADPPNYNPEQAKKLLTEAGWIDKAGVRQKDGKKLALRIYSPPAGYHLMGGEALLAIQESLRKVGFDCTVSISDYPAFNAEFYGKTLAQRTEEEKADGRGDAHFIDFGSRTDPWFTLKPRLHSGDWYPDKKGSIFYRDLELDRLVDAAELEVDPAKRAAIYKKAQITVAADTPLINLWEVNRTLAKKKSVQGVAYHPISATESHLDVREAWLDAKQ